jgi:hypothetical protein
MTGPRTPVVVAVALLLLSVAPPAATARPTASDATSGSMSTCTARADRPAAQSGSIGVETFVAPAVAFHDLTNASAIERAGERGILTRPQSAAGAATDELDVGVARGDTVVHRITVSGSATALLDRLESANGSTPTARFANLTDRDGIEFEYVGPTACPPALNLTGSIRADELHVVPGNRSLSLVVDSDGLLFERPEPGTESERWDWGHRAMRLSLTPSTGLVDDGIEVETDYDVVERDVRFGPVENGSYRRVAAPGQPVSGVTTVAPGSEIRVGWRPLGTERVANTTTTRVNASSGFTATLDLSNVEPGVYALDSPGLETDEPPTLLVVEDTPGAVLDLHVARGEGAVEGVSFTATTTDGGIVVVRNATGDVVGTSIRWSPGPVESEFDLDAPFRANQTITATLYRDVNGNETFDAADEPYRVGGSPVTDTANVTVFPERTDGQPTTTTTAQPDSTPTVEPGETAATTTTGPGFSTAVGVLAVALVALALVRRRVS